MSELEELRAKVARVEALMSRWMRDESRSADYQDGRADSAEELRAALAEPETPEPVLTGAHPYPVCICIKCGPPFRAEVPDWQSSGPFGAASWMALCPTCGSKRCSGAVDHRNHPNPEAL